MFKKYEITFKVEQKAFCRYNRQRSIVAVGYNQKDAIERLMKAKPFNIKDLKAVKEVSY